MIPYDYEGEEKKLGIKLPIKGEVQYWYSILNNL